MRPRSHELESQLRARFCESLRAHESGSEAADQLRLDGVSEVLDELAAENEQVLAELEQTGNSKFAVLNRPELIHFAAVLGSSATVLQQLLRAVDSPLARRYFPLSGIWRPYAAALVNLHRGVPTQVALPKPKGNEKYYLPYLRYMTISDDQEAEPVRATVVESFEARNRDRRFTDWIGLDGDGEQPVRWDFRHYAIEAGRRMRFD